MTHGGGARSMTALRALAAVFEDERAGSIGPLTFALSAKERTTLEVASPRAASIAARMCAAIVKPTSGTIYVGEYDTRLQPPQAKRRIGFIDAAGFAGDAHTFECELAFRADVWGLNRRRMRDRAQDVVAALGALHDAYARALALALVADVELIVVDQPTADMYAALAMLAPELAVLETRVARAAPRRKPEPAPA